MKKFHLEFKDAERYGWRAEISSNSSAIDEFNNEHFIWDASLFLIEGEKELLLEITFQGQYDETPTPSDVAYEFSSNFERIRITQR